MKKLCIFAIIFASTFTLRACKSEQCVVTLNRENSYYGDYEIDQGNVNLWYYFELNNSTQYNQNVKITISLPEDKKGGLISEENLAQNIVVEPGIAVYKVIFTSSFSGTKEKQNRLLPDQIRVEIIP